MIKFDLERALAGDAMVVVLENGEIHDVDSFERISPDSHRYTYPYVICYNKKSDKVTVSGGEYAPKGGFQLYMKSGEHLNGELVDVTLERGTVIKNCLFVGMLNGDYVVFNEENKGFYTASSVEKSKPKLTDTVGNELELGDWVYAFSASSLILSTVTRSRIREGFSYPIFKYKKDLFTYLAEQEK